MQMVVFFAHLSTTQLEARCSAADPRVQLPAISIVGCWGSRPPAPKGQGAIFRPTPPTTVGGSHPVCCSREALGVLGFSPLYLHPPAGRFLNKNDLAQNRGLTLVLGENYVTAA